MWLVFNSYNNLSANLIVVTLHCQAISKGRQGRDAQNLVKVNSPFHLPRRVVSRYFIGTLIYVISRFI